MPRRPRCCLDSTGLCMFRCYCIILIVSATYHVRVVAWSLANSDAQSGIALSHSSGLRASAIGFEDKTKEICNLLPPLGTCKSILAGEAAEVQRRKGKVNASEKYSKPDARIRLFCLYGIADSSVSMRKWIKSAPDWLEVRIVELPGHGYVTEGLPPCSCQVVEPLPNEELGAQRHEWVQSLTDQIEPLLMNESGDSIYYAFYGFSFGALMSYLVCKELENRGLSPPLALFACGRGAPHVIPSSVGLQQNLQLWDDDQLLDFIESKLGLATSTIAANRRLRMSALLRCGMIFSCLYAGDEPDKASRLNSADSIWDDDKDRSVCFATNLPYTNCPIISITGSLDTMWPPALVEKWCEGTLQYYQYHCLEGVAHAQLMNAVETKAIVFEELGRMALEREGIKALTQI